MIWGIILLAGAGIAFGMGCYLSSRVLCFRSVGKVAERKGRRKVRWAAFGLVILLAALVWWLWGLVNSLFCMAHLSFFWLIADLAGRLVRRKRYGGEGPYWEGAAALVLCAVYLAGGWYADHHVSVTRYAFETGKLEGNLRVVQVTDSHVGATFHADGLLGYIEEINELSPDVVVFTGDFVDDDTTREDMLGSCEALGELRTRYGVYFVYGNHDKGYSREEEKGWTNRELREALEENGVILLEDEVLLVDGRFYVAGRKDRSEAKRGGSRLSAARLLERAGQENRYTILLDHQPHDFDEEAEAGADLVLCGHTHGGQFIPILHVGEWAGVNCLTYGHEKRQGTDFIVSSGISNWAFKFKTGCHSEYVVIDITGTGGAGPAAGE